MAFKYKINKVDYAEYPAPADNDEEYENNNAYNVLFPKHNGKPYKQFN